MKRRLFIAVLFPKETLDAIEREMSPLRAKFATLVRFSPRENLHLTLIFLGDQDETDIPSISEAMDSVLQRFSKDALSFENFSYGPQEHIPRMIWMDATLQTSAYLGKIKSDISQALKARGVEWKEDYPLFYGHITLARFHEQPAATPSPLLMQNRLIVREYAVGLFDSTLTADGSEYTLLHSYYLEKA